MPPVLYSTDLLSLNATPISRVQSGDQNGKVPRKAKKERTPAQAEALAKARQKRIVKLKESAETPTPAGEQECETKPEMPPSPVSIQVETQDPLKTLKEELEAERKANAALKIAVESKKRERDEDEPPAWFANYLVGIKTEQAKIAKKQVPKRVIREDAEEAATTHWKEPLTRSRVNHEVDSHMHRLHSMIFGDRR